MNAVLKYPASANPTRIAATLSRPSVFARFLRFSSSLLQGGCVMPRGLLFLLIISVSAIFALAQGTNPRPRTTATPALKGDPAPTPKKPALNGGAQKPTPQSNKAPTEES